MYAYTTSELQVAILRLFVRAECRLPNLFVGTLTRESVTQALEFGVQADQIVSFLRQHAHPHVLHKVPIVPEVCAALCYLHNPHHSDSMAQTGFIARPRVDTLRIKACDWGRQKPHIILVSYAFHLVPSGLVHTMAMTSLHMKAVSVHIAVEWQLQLSLLRSSCHASLLTCNMFLSALV